MATDPNPNQEWLKRAQALRQEAWAALTNHPSFAAVKAFDDAVVAVGGETILPKIPRTPSAVDAFLSIAANHISASERVRRLSQGDAAAAVLRELEEPASVSDILGLMPEKGVKVGGEKPLVNLTSTLSKDDRFESVRHNGSYYWWFKGEPLPPGWDASTGPSLLDGPAETYLPSNQEGGDGHGPATT